MRIPRYFNPRVVFVLLLFIFGTAQKSQAQISSTGKLFYLSFMEMEARTGGYPDSLLLYITSTVNTKVVIDNPRISGTAATYTITANKVNRFSLDPGFYYPQGSELPGSNLESKRSLRITATDPINVYVMNLELNRSDATFVLPYESIPKAPEFFVTAYTPTQRVSGKFMPSEFVIVGMDKNVEVEITPTTKTVGGQIAGTPWTVTLSVGQVYQVQSDNADGDLTGNTAVGDLTGTRIRVVNGCGKINVFAGMKSVRIPSSSCGVAVDHLYTQVFPSKILGKQHVVMPFKNQNGGYMVRVVATKPNTKIYVDGVLASTKNAGQYYQLNVTSAVARCITADSNIYVVQYMKNGGSCAGTTGNNGDPAILIMPDNNQKILKSVVGTATTNNMKLHYLNILVDTKAKAAVKLNGSLLSSTLFTDVPCAGHSYVQVQVNNPSTNTIECDSGLIVVVYGIGQYESYSYCSGALFESLDFDIKITQPNKCPQYPVKLDAIKVGKIPVYQYLWDFGDGAKDTGTNVVHSFLKTGSFYVVLKAVVPGTCPGTKDTITRSRIIVVKPGPILKFPDSMQICADSLNVVFDGGANVKYLYKWQDSSTAQKFTAKSAGKVWLRVRDTSTACVTFDSTLIILHKKIYPAISYDTLRECITTNYFSLSDKTTYTNDQLAYNSWRLSKPYGGKLTVNGPRFMYTFDTTGSYNLRYYVHSKNTCFDSVDVKLNIYHMPTAVWAAPNFEYCAKAAAKFDDSSYGEGGIGNSYWDFGDGASGSSTNKTINHKYTTFDTFAVRLITETIHMCRDTADSTIIIRPLPKVAIQATVNNICLKQNSFTFTDASGIDIGTFTNTWKYNKNVQNNQATISNISFPDSGSYIVRLIETSDRGCIDSADHIAKVAKEPKARILVPDSNYCLNSNWFSFNDMSSPGWGTIATRNWAFSNGTTSQAASISKKKFANAGNYTTKLVVSNSYGCKDSVVRSFDVLKSPSSKFTVNDSTQCFVGNNFAFAPVGAGVTGPTYDWDFGDNSSSPTINPTHSYSATGNFTVRLIVSSGTSCADTTKRIMTVDVTPKAGFVTNIDSTCMGVNTFNYTNTSVFGGTLNFNWTLGDGNKSTATDITGKSYASPGNFTVKLVANTAQGCKDSVSRLVKVFAVPTAAFSVNKANQCLVNNDFIFTNNSTSNGANGLTYNWTVNPGSTYSTMAIPNQNFPAVGTYNIKLDVSSDRNCKSSYNMDVKVDETPAVSIVVPPSACLGEKVDFSSTATVGSGTITNYNWTFGDGGTDVTPAPSHVYNIAGNFMVDLSVTSSAGCTNKTAAVGIVINPKPKADFTYKYLLSRGLETDYTFQSTSTNATQFLWTFGDGQFSALTSFPITFTDTGNMPAKLMVMNDFGCMDSITKFLFLKPELQYYVPGTFTPNKDNLNDMFIGSSAYGMSKYHMRVYDRWGGMLFESKDAKKGWDGKNSDGKLAAEGVYAYSITFRYIDGNLHVYKGTITILR